MKEAEAHAESDKRHADRVQARITFEHFVHVLKRLVDDDGSDLGDSKSISQSEKTMMHELIEDALEWIHANPDAEREVYEGKVQELKQTANAFLSSDVS